MGKPKTVGLKMTGDAVDAIYTAVSLEIVRAEKKFPGWPEDIVHGAAIVAEESGELVQAALQQAYEDGDYSAVVKEAVQTAAMSVRFLLYLRGIAR